MRLRFNLRTVFVLFTLAIVPLATLSYKYHAVQRQQRAIERFRAMGLSVISRNPPSGTSFERLIAPIQVREVEVTFPGAPRHSAPHSYDALAEKWKSDPSSREEVVELLQAMRPIRRLVIYQQDIDDHWGEVIAELREVRNIEANDSTFSEAAVRSIAGLPKLECLWVQRCGWSDTEVRSLVRCRSLIELALRGRGITDDSVKHLGSLPKLEYLGLGGTAISDGAIEHLGKSRALKGLYLSGTNISDDALNELARISALSSVDLSGTQITAEGFVTLSEKLPLQYMRLDHDVPAGALAEIRTNRPGIRIEIAYFPRPEPSSGNPFEITFATISSSAIEAGSDNSP